MRKISIDGHAYALIEYKILRADGVRSLESTNRAFTVDIWKCDNCKKIELTDNEDYSDGS